MDKHAKELRKAIGDRIRGALEEKDWFQQQLADAIGTDKSNLTRIIQGQTNVTIDTIAAIEKALGKQIIKVS